MRLRGRVSADPVLYRAKRKGKNRMVLDSGQICDDRVAFAVV